MDLSGAVMRSFPLKCPVFHRKPRSYPQFYPLDAAWSEIAAFLIPRYGGRLVLYPF